MKVAYVVPYISEGSAIGEYTFQLADVLAKYGFQGYIITKQSARTNLPRTFQLLNSKDPWTFLKAANFVLNIISADVVHIQDDIFSFVPWLNLFIERVKKLPVILTTHEVIFERTDGGIRRLYSSRGGLIEPFIKYGLFAYHRRLCNQVDKIIVHNKEMRLRLISCYGIPPNAVAVVPHGANPDMPYKRNYSRYNRIVFLGLLTPHKGINVLIKAYEEVVKVEPEVKLIVIGGPQKLLIQRKWYGRLLKKIAASRAKHGIRMMGYLPPERVWHYLLNSDMMVLPYNDVSHSSAAVKAMVAGLPVIATRVGGFKYQVRNGVTGLLVKPGFSEELAGAMIKLLRDYELRKRLGTNARREAEERLGWKSMAPLYVKLYQEFNQNLRQHL